MNDIGDRKVKMLVENRETGQAPAGYRRAMVGFEPADDLFLSRLAQDIVAIPDQLDLGGCAIEHFSECPMGISKPIKLFFVSIVGFISSNESIVQPKVVNGPIEIFYGADS